ncbi:MAG: twin-arginine translocase TatA/TatE family subunit [Alphaproteobacteria bacterium]|nr:twin-arginine translocase TatA/TatE family subunit [Alphaproteobacteria bacterium]
MNFGFGEILLLLAVVLILFGAGRISGIMGEFGKGLSAFKKGLKDDGESSDSSEKKD